MNQDNNLDEIYSAQNSDATRKAYEGWASKYDIENIGTGYRVPSIGCALFARNVNRDSGLIYNYAGPIYDAACDTGIVGQTLDLLGYK